MNVIGIDVSKLTLSCFDGRDYFEIKNNRRSVASFVARADKNNTRLIYEATGPYSLALDMAVMEKGVPVLRVNPRDSKHFSQAIKRRNKTDELDAKMLWEMRKIAKEEDYKVLKADKSAKELEEFLSYYDFLQKQIVALKNRLESETLKGNKWISKELQGELKIIEKKQDKTVEKMLGIVHGDKELSERFNCVKSVSGINDKSSLLLTVFFLKYPGMNKKELIALAGLDPVEATSGTSVKKKTRISKRGSAILRKMLFMPVLSMLRRDTPFKILYDRMVERGKVKKVAVIAVMKKILIIAHALFTKNQVFDRSKYLSAIGVKNLTAA